MPEKGRDGWRGQPMEWPDLWLRRSDECQRRHLLSGKALPKKLMHESLFPIARGTRSALAASFTDPALRGSAGTKPEGWLHHFPSDQAHRVQLYVGKLQLTENAAAFLRDD